MIEHKAVAAGLIATIIIGIANQLFFILAAAAIGNAHDSYGILSSYKHELWFACGMMTYCLTMAIGGAITAWFTCSHVALNAALVGALAGILSLATSVGEDEFTPMSILLVILGTAFAAIGAMAWKRRRSSHVCRTAHFSELNPEHR